MVGFIVSFFILLFYEADIRDLSIISNIYFISLQNVRQILFKLKNALFLDFCI